MSRSVFASLRIVFLMLAVCAPAVADDVTLSGASTFAEIDGSASDHDGLVNGVFTVSDGNLTILGTVTCIDAGPGNASACPMQFTVSGNLTLSPGSSLYAENRRAQGSGGNITIHVGGDLVLAGSSVALPGAVISSDSFGNDAGGDITLHVSGSSTLGAGSAVSAASAGGNAGAISVQSGGSIVASGLVASGPGRLTGPSTVTGEILTGGSSNQRGGAITLASASRSEPAVTITAGAVVVSQGENNGSGSVRIDGCGVEIRGVVASNANGGSGSAVSIRSGTTLMIDGADLGTAGTRRGQVRADSTGGDASSHRIRILARHAIQLSGPPLGSVSAITADPGGNNGSGGLVEVVSTEAGITLSGNVIHAGDTQNGRSGGVIQIAAKASLDLDGAVLRAAGDNPANNEHGGVIAIRSHSGAVSWQNGTGDVRPNGSAAGVPAASQGTISITYCTTVSTSGTSFPVNGSAVGVFPTTVSSCSPAAPSLPAGESLPDCNEPPTANDDGYAVAEGGTLAISAPGVLANDVEPDGQPMTAALVSGPAHGTVNVSPDGSFTYTHDGGETNTDQFTYTASDGSLTSNVATVTITVAPVNDAPVAVNDAYGVAEGGTLNVAAPGVLANDQDLDGPTMTALLVSGPSHGTLAINPDGSFLYTHDGSETTSDFFTYRASDGALTSNNATVTIAVTPVNDAPVANPDSYTASFHGTLNVPAPGVLGNDTDPDSSIVAILVSGPSSGTLTLNANGSFTYVHSGTSLSDAFTYKANDGTADSNVTTVTLTVVAEPPVANNDFFAAVGNTERRVGTGASITPAHVSAGSVLANDTDPDTPPAGLMVTAFDSTSAAGGSVSVLPNGAFNYLPPVGFTGSDTFSYTVSDGLSSDSATVTMGVANRVWYVNNAASPGDGRSTSPFGTLAAAEAASAANDFIYVHTGNGTMLGQDAGIVLKFAQQLVGEGVALLVGGNVLHPAGAAPTIGHATGNGVRLGNGNTVAGLRIAASAHGIDGNAITAGTIRSVEIAGGTDAIHLTGTAGTFAISDVALSPGAAGLVIDGGTPAVTASNLDITTTTGTGIVGTGTGSLTTLSGSTVNASAGKAIDITDMTVDIAVTSLSAAGANTGVSLQNTSGRFVVAPDGPGSAGTIQNTLSRGVSVIGAAPQQMVVRLSNFNVLNGAAANGTPANVCGDTFNGANLGCNAGIHLENVQELLLAGVVVDGSAQIGVNGNNVSAVTLDNVRVANAGTETFEHGVQFVNATGNFVVRQSVFENNFYRQFTIQNSAGSLDLDVEQGRFTGRGLAVAGGAQGALVSGHGAASIVVRVRQSVAENNFSTGWLTDGTGSAALNATISNSTFRTNGGGGLTLAVAGGSSLAYEIAGNAASGNAGPGITIFKGSFSTGTVSGSVVANTLGTAGLANSACGSAPCEAISLSAAGTGVYTARVSGNVVRNFRTRAIGASMTEGVSANLSITTNDIAEPAVGASSSIFVQSGSLATHTTSVCADIAGNAISGAYTTGILVRNRFPTTLFRLPGFGGPGNSTAAVAAFLAGQNGGALATATINGNTFDGGAACATP